MENTYTFKQIIFGLRKEYVEINKQLSELKKYVNISSKVEDFDFHIAGDPCKMFLYLHKKKNMLEKLELLLGLYIHGMTNYDVTEEIKNTYYYQKKALCHINNPEELSSKIKQITDTDFFKNIVANNYTSIPCVENQTNTLLIAPSYIGLINGVNGDYPHLDYYAKEDEFVMRNKEKIITPNDIFSILNLNLNGKFLNDYHRNILDNYEQKEIDIDDNFDSREAKIEIIEEPKKLILRQKKKISY